MNTNNHASFPISSSLPSLQKRLEKESRMALYQEEIHQKDMERVQLLHREKRKPMGIDHRIHAAFIGCILADSKTTLCQSFYEKDNRMLVSNKNSLFCWGYHTVRRM